MSYNQLNQLRSTIDYFISTGSIFTQHLVDIERKMVSSMLEEKTTVVPVKEVPVQEAPVKEVPWYPDNSGDWIEFDGDIRPYPSDMVEVLLGYERTDEEWQPEARQAYTWDWTEIVAYKKV